MITFEGPRCSSLSSLRIRDLPKLLAVRRMVPREALGNPRMGLGGLYWWYLTVHLPSRWARAIHVDGRFAGYVAVNRKGDLGILIGPPGLRGHGIGTWAVHAAIRGARRAGVETLTCGTTVPKWFERFGFVAGCVAIQDKGVWRQRMEMRLIP